MFLKSLTIAKGNGTIIRQIPFRVGINLIVDETPVVNGEDEGPIVDGKATGNNVGKTTVLKLVDFCLGAKSKIIYTDPENNRHEYKLVKDFLIENEVLISLVLKDDLSNEESVEVKIERNFLARNKKIQRFNGEDKTDEEFEEALTNLLFPGHFGKKPTFRQIVAHNIRYRDSSINNTLKNLDRYTSDVEYETLYLFLLGCDFEEGDAKQELRGKLDIEEKFKKRLESEQTRSAYETVLNLILADIKSLERKRASFNLNPNFESDLEKLNGVKYQINLTASQIGRLELRKQLILEAQAEIQAGKSTVDVQQLKQIYSQATLLVPEIQKTFAELNDFHNQMIASKIQFIAQDIPKIEIDLATKRAVLKGLRADEGKLSSLIVQSDSFAEVEKLIVELNSKYEAKGKFENIIAQVDDVDKKIASLNERLSVIDNELFSDDFAAKIQEQVNKFNKHFSEVSFELYGERYALKPDVKIVKGRRVYEFTAFNLNFSSGKKQGEISCFDIAYTFFADEENIPCMHFLLNDKKELMHDNQLLRIAGLVDEKGLQFVASILKDKLPADLNKDEYTIVKLSQKDKLLRIEQAN